MLFRSDEKVFRKYCYPSKTLSAMIKALLYYRQITQSAEEAEKALRIAVKMADWLIDNSCAKGTPLEYLPPTYWRYAEYQLAKPHIGQIMMIYPMTVGCAYLRVYRATGERRYLDAALRLAETMKRLQLPCGSWILKLYEKDGESVVQNIVVLNETMMKFMTELAEISGDKSFIAMRDKAYSYVLENNLRLWNWDGQFEDVIPKAIYENLTKDGALFVASELFRQGDIARALEIVDWSEDQFVVCSSPNPQIPGYQTFVLPVALEQYHCYSPVDASLGRFIFAFSEAYKYTHDRLYLEKAKALADCVLRNQRPDGSIPTWFCQVDLPDWVNCMIYAAESLQYLARVIETDTGESSGDLKTRQ